MRSEGCNRNRPGNRNSGVDPSKVRSPRRRWSAGPVVGTAEFSNDPRGPLHYIALVQCRITPETQAYMARQREAGKSHKEAMRCLKRQLSNTVYRHLVADARKRSWRLDNIEGLVRGSLASSQVTESTRAPQRGDRFEPRRDYGKSAGVWRPGRFALWAKCPEPAGGDSKTHVAAVPLTFDLAVPPAGTGPAEVT